MWLSVSTAEGEAIIVLQIMSELHKLVQPCFASASGVGMKMEQKLSAVLMGNRNREGKWK